MNWYVRNVGSIFFPLIPKALFLWRSEFFSLRWPNFSTVRQISFPLPLGRTLAGFLSSHSSYLSSSHIFWFLFSSSPELSHSANLFPFHSRRFSLSSSCRISLSKSPVILLSRQHSHRISHQNITGGHIRDVDKGKIVCIGNINANHLVSISIDHIFNLISNVG